MKHLTKTEQIVDVLHHMECDRCKRIDDDLMQMQEYFSLKQAVGYMGILGDGNYVELDLCQYCFKELFTGIFRYTGSYIRSDGSPWVPPEGFMMENK